MASSLTQAMCLSPQLGSPCDVIVSCGVTSEVCGVVTDSGYVFVPAAGLGTEGVVRQWTGRINSGGLLFLHDGVPGERSADEFGCAAGFVVPSSQSTRAEAALSDYVRPCRETINFVQVGHLYTTL